MLKKKISMTVVTEPLRVRFAELMMLRLGQLAPSGQVDVVGGIKHERVADRGLHSKDRMREWIIPICSRSSAVANTALTFTSLTCSTLVGCLRRPGSIETVAQRALGARIKAKVQCFNGLRM